MTNYVFVYYDTAGKPASEVRDAWGAWFGKLGDKVVDHGNPFNAGAQAVSSDGAMAVDRPATGYSIVKADSMAEATELTKDCPAITGGGAVCVYETLPM